MGLEDAKMVEKTWVDIQVYGYSFSLIKSNTEFAFTLIQVQEESMEPSGCPSR